MEGISSPLSAVVDLLIRELTDVNVGVKVDAAAGAGGRDIALGPIGLNVQQRDPRVAIYSEVGV